MSRLQIPEDLQCREQLLGSKRCYSCEYHHECRVEPGTRELSTWELSRVHLLNNFEWDALGRRHLKPSSLPEYHLRLDEYFSHPARLVATPKELEEWYSHWSPEVPSPRTHKGKFGGYL